MKKIAFGIRESTDNEISREKCGQREFALAYSWD